jgi:hypothetical protein
MVFQLLQRTERVYLKFHDILYAHAQLLKVSRDAMLLPKACFILSSS